MITTMSDHEILQRILRAIEGDQSLGVRGIASRMCNLEEAVDHMRSEFRGEIREIKTGQIKRQSIWAVIGASLGVGGLKIKEWLGL